MTDRFDYRRIFVIGLGFFSISIVWQLYNSFMPLMLGDFIESKMIRGFIMGIDNIANIFLIPVIGAWSDRVLDRGYGKRLPFLWVGMPIAALFMLVMPHYTSLWTLILIDIGFLLAMTLFRSPTVALMPDVTPESHRSQANGIINFMGGIGALITLFMLSPLYDTDKLLPFYIGGGFLLAVIVILTLYLRKLHAKPVLRPDTAPPEAEPALKQLFAEVRTIFTSKQHAPILYTLLAIFFWFIGYSAVEAQFTTYGVEFLGLKEGVASLTLGFFSLTFIIFAIPSGWIGKRWGRPRTIQYGIIGLVAMFILLFFIRDLLLIRIVMLLGGLCWALINIHSYPMIVKHATGAKIGLYTGIYYFFSSIAAAIGPFLLGGVMDAFGYPALFIGASLALVAALWCMRKVKTTAMESNS